MAEFIPRFMTDKQLMEHSGFGHQALTRPRLTGQFPGKDPLVGKTDSKAVDAYFDRRAGLAPPIGEALDYATGFKDGLARLR